MTTKSCAGLIVCVSFFAISSSRADVVLDFAIETDRDSYVIGGIVNWALFVRTNDTDTGTAVDIAGISVDLNEDTGEALNVAQIDPLWADNLYAGSGGTAQGPSIEEISFICLAVSPFNCEPLGADGVRRPFASGSYEVNVPGVHTLSTATPFPIDNGYFDPAVADFARVVNFGQPNTLINNASSQFSVVPEPGGVKLMLLASVLWFVTGGLAFWHRRQTIVV